MLYAYRVGETQKNLDGTRMVISHYRNVSDIDVLFKDGRKADHVSYSDFKSGRIQANHDNTKSDTNTDMIGKMIPWKDGETATILEYNSPTDITVRLGNGEIICHVNPENIGTDEDESVSVSHGIGIQAERKRTYANVLSVLERYRRCIMIRPCGFGKTWIGIKLFRQYRKCLFLHPQKDEFNLGKVQASKPENVDTRTYAWLRRLTDEAIQKLDYDFVFLDECHTVGGDKDGNGAYVTYQAVMKLMAWHPETHFLGATATAIRMDGINVIEKVFLNHTCYPYTDMDAFEDGLLTKPFYYYSIYDVEKKIRERLNDIAKNVHLQMNREQIEKLIGSTPVNEVDARYMDKHIREKCDEHLPDTSYMRFIVFYLTNEDILENKGKVEKWFAKAYPEHQICSMIVTTRTNVSLTAVDNLPTAPTKEGYKGRIDLIFNCEKLCLGYHSEKITGLVMDRKTASIAKYQQMIGRLLSARKEQRAIIFDVVDNLHNDFVVPQMEDKENNIEFKVPTKKEETFLSVVKENPNAIHWDRIPYKNVNPKEKPVEGRTTRFVKLIGKTYIRKSSVDSGQFYGATEALQDNNTASSITTIEETQRTSVQPAESPTAHFADGMDKMATVTSQNSDPQTISDTGKRSFVFSVKRQGHTGKGTLHIGKKAKYLYSSEKQDSPLSMENIPVEVERPCGEFATEKEGYVQGSYYYINGDLYSKAIRNSIESVDIEKEIRRVIKEFSDTTCQAVLEKWHTYPGCEKNYTSDKEIDTRTGKFKLLKACASLYCCPMEHVLRYMLQEEKKYA